MQATFAGSKLQLGARVRSASGVEAAGRGPRPPWALGRRLQAGSSAQPAKWLPSTARRGLPRGGPPSGRPKPRSTPQTRRGGGRPQAGPRPGGPPAAAIQPSARPPPARSRKSVNTTVVASGAKKIDISKQGLNSIQNETVKLNLMGKSKTMESKDWVDPQGRKGKVRAAAGGRGGPGLCSHTLTMIIRPKQAEKMRSPRQKRAPTLAESARPPAQGYGVYRFANKYGANVDGYSPIYTPDTWSESGEHSLGRAPAPSERASMQQSRLERRLRTLPPPQRPATAGPV